MVSHDRWIQRWAVPVSVVALLSLSLAPVLALAGPSAEQFRLYKDYLDAQGDERVQKLPESKRLSAIAKNFKVKDAVLKAAVEAVSPVAATLASDAAQTIRKNAEATPLAGRVTDVSVDDAHGHAVAYVSWRSEDPARLEEEAAHAALLAANGASFVTTVAVWATDAAGTKVFEAKIGASAAQKFNPARIPMFAKARYILQFEGVRNTYAGTPPSDAAPGGTGVHP